MSHIGILEDSEVLRMELAGFFSQRGHTVYQAGTLAEFWPLMENIELAILDINLPDGEGFDAAKRMRAEKPRSAIILLTARQSLEDKLNGLNGGADVHLSKPFKLLELEAYVNSLLRKIGQGWRLCSQRRALLSPSGQQLLLKPPEYQICELFADHADAVIDKRTMVEALGHDWCSYDLRRLDKLISRLRLRWETLQAEPFPLRTEFKAGYRFDAMLTRQ
jgi:DNA-binding response OmpR family regulator